VEVHKTGEVITGTVTSKTKGGLIVDVFGMETFLPGSQIDVKPVTDYDQFVGKTMEFKVVKINEAIKNAVVSHKALIESDIEAQRAQIMANSRKDRYLEGTVKNITDFGAFHGSWWPRRFVVHHRYFMGSYQPPKRGVEDGSERSTLLFDFDDEKKAYQLLV
jgi:small subunit ribosomal protein S1